MLLWDTAHTITQRPHIQIYTQHIHQYSCATIPTLVLTRVFHLEHIFALDYDQYTTFTMLCLRLTILLLFISHLLALSRKIHVLQILVRWRVVGQIHRVKRKEKEREEVYWEDSEGNKRKME